MTKLQALLAELPSAIERAAEDAVERRLAERLPEERLLTPKEAAKMLGVSPRTLRDRLEYRKALATLPGQRPRYSLRALNRIIENALDAAPVR
jgi:hypothetical protein